MHTFVPSVRDLTDRGFALMGGRVEYLDGRPVAALVLLCYKMMD